MSLPQAFSDAGYLAGTVLLAVLAMMSAVTSTFMVEAMSLSNALTLIRTKKGVQMQVPSPVRTTPPPLEKRNKHARARTHHTHA